MSLKEREREIVKGEVEIEGMKEKLEQWENARRVRQERRGFKNSVAFLDY